jgi:hypothetical protein
VREKSVRGLRVETFSEPSPRYKIWCLLAGRFEVLFFSVAGYDYVVINFSFKLMELIN